MSAIRLHEREYEERKYHNWHLFRRWVEDKTVCRKKALFQVLDGYDHGLCIFDKDSANCDACMKLESSETQEEPTEDAIISLPLEFVTPQKKPNGCRQGEKGLNNILSFVTPEKCNVAETSGRSEGRNPSHASPSFLETQFSGTAPVIDSSTRHMSRALFTNERKKLLFNVSSEWQKNVEGTTQMLTNINSPTLDKNQQIAYFNAFCNHLRTLCLKCFIIDKKETIIVNSDVCERCEKRNIYI